MMKLIDVLKKISPHKHPKRVGRGPGSGHGKTSTKGHKGAKARSGLTLRAGFEGGQMPLIRRIPKRGFTNKFRRTYTIVNVESLNRFKKDENIDPALLKKEGVIDNLRSPIKILGDGALKKPLIVKAQAFSKSAKKKIEEAGGKAEIA